MKRVSLDKIASAAKNAGITNEAYLSEDIIAKEGYVVAVKILTDKAVYNQLENIHGRMTRLKPGDLIAGVLGHRRALRGYAGDVPSSVKTGDTLNLLNIGGVIGKCTSYATDVGVPFNVEVLGSVLHFPHLGERMGEPAHIGLRAIPLCGLVVKSAPIIGMVGTCMNAGKTQAACEIIHGLTRRGLKVAAGKVTGVALQRDVLNMKDYGAVEALSFIDAGVVTTKSSTSVDAARRIITKLNESRPDVIVIEFGDGLLGEYGVQAILKENDLTSWINVLILCANDPVGAWGGVKMLMDKYNLKVNIVSGPVTDNEVGTAYVEANLEVLAANALVSPDLLVTHVWNIMNCTRSP